MGFYSRALTRRGWHGSIFLGMLGYIEMAVVDTFEQIQHDSNPLLAILAETFRSLNYYRRN